MARETTLLQDWLDVAQVVDRLVSAHGRRTECIDRGQRQGETHRGRLQREATFGRPLEHNMELRPRGAKKSGVTSPSRQSHTKPGNRADRFAHWRSQARR